MGWNLYIRIFTKHNLLERRNERCLKQKKELKGLVRASRHSLAEAEERVSQREKMIRHQQEENLELYEENKDIRSRYEESIELIKRIKYLAEATTYNNDRARLGKIKELTREFEATC